MSRFRSEVLDWFESGRVAPGREAEALRVAGIAPSAGEWRAFLGQLTLWLGTIALASAVIFFFAFNWDDLGRFAKFGLVEAAILAGLLACWRLDLDGPAGKAVLLLLSLLAGALLALTGPIYQTGADPFQLFAWWAVLILPWVLVGRFAKFGLVESAIVAGLLACWRLDLEGPAGKAVLLLLSLLAGALLALTGQIYQTGADTFQLFAWWAVLILPWVLVSRFSPLWLVWLALLNLAVYLYFQIAWELEGLLWALFGLNSLALIGWEAAHRMGVEWLRDDWPPRLVAIGSGVFATALVVWATMGGDGGGSVALAVLAYLAWLAAFYFWYRRRRPDLFMLAGGVLSLIVATVTLLSRNMFDSGSTGFLLIGLVVIGMSAGGAIWLKSVGREQRA